MEEAVGAGGMHSRSFHRNAFIGRLAVRQRLACFRGLVTNSVGNNKKAWPRSWPGQ